MKIGIIYAMRKEIFTYIYKFYQLKKIKNKIYGISIYQSYSKKVFIIQSGIGKVSSSIACTILINIYKINMIINIGSGGALKSYIQTFDIVIGKKLYYHDVNVSGFHYPVGQIPGFPKFFQTNKYLRKSMKNILYKYKLTFWEGKIISGDQFIYQNRDINKIKKYFYDAISVDMESTAISQVCFQHHIPVIIIKIISDHANKKSPLIFQKNIKNISLKFKKFIVNYIKIIQIL